MWLLGIWSNLFNKQQPNHEYEKDATYTQEFDMTGDQNVWDDFANEQVTDAHSSNIKIPSVTVTYSSAKSGNICTIIVNHSLVDLKESAWRKTERNPAITTQIQDNKAALISAVPFMNKKVNVLTPHILDMMPFDKMSLYSEINPNVLVGIGKYNKERLYYRRHASSTECIIYTRTADMQHDYMISTSISNFVKVPIIDKGRQMFTLAYIIVKITLETKVIWSGSVVENDGTIYIITSSTKQEVGSDIILFGCAMYTHDYGYQLIIK